MSKSVVEEGVRPALVFTLIFCCIEYRRDEISGRAGFENVRIATYLKFAKA